MYLLALNRRTSCRSRVAGAGPNGAIIHYRAQPGTCRTVDGNTLLLLDSGAQFDCECGCFCEGL